MEIRSGGASHLLKVIKNQYQLLKGYKEVDCIKRKVIFSTYQNWHCNIDHELKTITRKGCAYCIETSAGQPQ